MKMANSTVLRTAIGRYPHSAAALDGTMVSPVLRIEDAGIRPIPRAFAPMVREGRFEASEMALATFLMAKSARRPLVLLPVIMAARSQEASLLCRADGPVRGPADLAGCRVGVRAYSQTTGMWVRGTLQHGHGITSDAIRWVAFEDAHIAEHSDPPWVERAPAGADMIAMLRDGSLDAVIFGSDAPNEPAFRTVFLDPEAAGGAFRTRYGFVPVNHLLVLRGDVADARPEVAGELIRLFGGITPPGGRAALEPAIAVAIRFCVEQGLLPQAPSLAEVWGGNGLADSATRH